MPSNNFSAIRQAIIDKLNSSEVTKVQVAYRGDRSQFEGYPAAVVSPTSNEADYSSTTSDRLSIVFEVRLYYIIEDLEDQDPVEIALEEALDELFDVFNEREVLGSACDWVTPVPSIWDYEERGDAVYRLATVTLSCVKYVGN